MRGDDHVVGGHREAVGRGPERLAAELVDGAALVDAAAGGDDRAREPGQIAARMESRLPVDAHPRPADHGHVADERGVEAELARQRGVVAEGVRLLRLSGAERRVQVAVDPAEAAVDAVAADDGVDLVDGRQPGVPDRLRVRRGRAESTSSRRRVSVTIVRCAVVCPVSISPSCARSSTTTRLPAVASR